MKNPNNKPKEQSFNAGNLDRKKIEHRAYQLYAERGGMPGHDCEDWLQAERELSEVEPAVVSR